MTQTLTRLLIAPALFLALAPAATAQEKPNFIVIFTDDQGWGDLGVQGSPDIRTPNIDRLAAEGIRFELLRRAVLRAIPSRPAHRQLSPAQQLGFQSRVEEYRDRHSSR